ncbi:MAG: TIGR04372 family glycosyltransferase [Proteobacteria bacterium]|nr:TIGR04372 family glycosyltransferase [Pseudomonadota bacterium]
MASAPDMPGAWHLLSTLGVAMIDPRAVAQAAWRAVAIDSNFAAGHINLGKALIALYETNPDLPGVFALHEKGLAALDRALRLDPDCLGYSYMAALHAAAGNPETTRTLYDEHFRRTGLLTETVVPGGFRIIPREVTRAIGNLALIDFYIKMLLLGWRPPHTVKAIAPPGKVANMHYLRCWRRYLIVIDDPKEIAEVEPHYRRGDCGIGGLVVQGRTRLFPEAAAAAQVQWEAERRPPLLDLDEEDAVRGEAVLREMGLGANDWFVGLHVRESGFHRDIGRNSPMVYRNASIDRFGPAIEAIAKRGGWVIRMGDPSMTPLGSHERVIDYAVGPRKSEWMDVFLCARGRFFLGSASGMHMVPATFGVPCAIANAAPMGSRPVFAADIFIPKLYWSKLEGRYLGFVESTAPPLGHAAHAGLFETRGVELVENTPEEIEGLVAEMLDRLDGSAGYSAEDEMLQARFRAETAPFSAWGTNSRIGRDFLRFHAALLESRQ